MSSITQDPRYFKGSALVIDGHVRPLAGPGRFAVASQSSEGTEYTVDCNSSTPHCTCEDFKRHGTRRNAPFACKHIHAVTIFQTRRREIESFVNRRGWTLQTLAVRLARKNPIATHERIVKEYIAVIRQMEDTTQPQPPVIHQARQRQAAAKAAAKYFVRFWWPNDDRASELIDPNSITIPPDPPTTFEFHNAERHAQDYYEQLPGQRLADLREHMEEQGLVILDTEKKRWDRTKRQALWCFAIGQQPEVSHG